jgi:hypothetical protein
MKKNIIFAIVFVSVLLLVGLSTAKPNIDIEQKQLLGPDLLILGDFIAKHGLKIWARGYGNFSCQVIENNENGPYEIWGPRFLTGLNKENTIMYDFFYDNDLTLINSPIPIPGCWIIFLLTSNLPRLNHRFPKFGPGPHELGWGYFMGGVCKGQTYDGEVKPPIEINGNTYAYYEIRGRSSICLSNDFNYFPSLKNFDYLSWVLQNRKTNLITWDSWKN